MRVFSTLATFFFLSLATLSAHNHYEGADSSSPNCPQFSIGADLLVWKPINSDNEFVTIVDFDPDPNQIRYQNFHYSWEPGFRVFVGMKPACSRWEFVLSYEQLNVKDHQSFVGSIDRLAISDLSFEPTFLAFENAFGSSSQDYQAVEVAAYYGRCLCDGHLFRPFTALQYLHLERAIHFSSTAPVALSSAFRGDYKGVGFTIGAEYTYNWLYGLAFYTKGGVTLNIGELNSKFHTNSPTQEVLIPAQYKNEGMHIIPELRLVLGLNKSFCVCGQELVAKLNYEFIDFINAPTIPSLQGNGSVAGFAGGNLGFHGFTFGLTAGF